MKGDQRAYWTRILPYTPGSPDTDAFVDVVVIPGGPYSAARAQGESIMDTSRAENLRKAIENLIDAKLQDVLIRPGGLERLLAHRRSGVASPDIRNAERRLENTLSELLMSDVGLSQGV